jgi:diguanylate cyclase (GGDEF)-like protein
MAARGAAALLAYLRWVPRLSEPLTLLITTAAVGGIAVVQWRTRLDLAIVPLYILTVAAATYHATLRVGLAMALCAAASAAAIEAATASTPYSLLAVIVGSLAMSLALVVTVLLANTLSEVVSRLERRAVVDPLTGLMSRSALLDAVHRAWSRAVRDGAAMTFAYFDVDGLKECNDDHGHSAGDEVLAAFGEATLRHARDYDLAGRMGGDEFLMVVPETGHDEVRRIAARVADAFRVSMPDFGRIGVSVGVVTARAGDGFAMEDMIRIADSLMYRAKRGGGNTLIGRDLVDHPDVPAITIDLTPQPLIQARSVFPPKTITPMSG